MVFKNKKINFLSVEALAYLLIVIYIIIFVFLCFGRHDGLKSYLNDLGTYDQIVWNSLHGRLFQTSGGIYAQSDDFSYLGGHFSPLLLLLIPFYLIWSNPKMLLLLQAIAVGVAGLPIYSLARDKIKSKWAGLVFLISYLFYPILHNALLYDFREVTLAVPFVAFALYFWHKKKYGWMTLFLILICLSQEHLPLIVFMFGLYLMFINKKWKMGGTIALVSLIYFILVLTVLMPSLSTTGGVDIVRSPSGEITRYSWLGSDINEMVKNVFTRPLWVLQNSFSWRRLDFLLTLFLPLLMLPLFSAMILLALPTLLLYFLSHFWMTYSIYYYHSAVLAGIFYFAAIFSFARLIKIQKLKKIFLVLILISSILVSYIYTVTPLSKHYSWKNYRPSEHAKLLKEVKKKIPSDASLAVQHNLGPHFTQRQKLYNLPKKIDEAEYLLIDVYNPYYGQSKKQFYGMVNVLAMTIDNWAKMIKYIFEDEGYGLIYEKDGYFIFQKGASRDLNEKGYIHFSQLFQEIIDDLEKHERL